MYMFICQTCNIAYTATPEVELQTRNGPRCPLCNSEDRVWLRGTERREELDGRPIAALPRADADPDLRGLPNKRRTMGPLLALFRDLGASERRDLIEGAGWTVGGWNAELEERASFQWIQRNPWALTSEQEGPIVYSKL